jgi:hypothetical protein
MDDDRLSGRRNGGKRNGGGKKNTENHCGAAPLKPKLQTCCATPTPVASLITRSPALSLMDRIAVQAPTKLSS